MRWSITVFAECTNRIAWILSYFQAALAGKEESCVANTAEALSSLLQNEPWIKPLVLEPLKASLIQRAMLRVLARRSRQGTNDSTPLPPNFNVGQEQKDSCKGNDLRRKLIARSWNL